MSCNDEHGLLEGDNPLTGQLVAIEKRRNDLTQKFKQYVITTEAEMILLEEHAAWIQRKTEAFIRHLEAS